MNLEENYEEFLTAPPLPRKEMIDFVKKNIQYNKICSLIDLGELKGKAVSIEMLDRIVRTIVDLQYREGEMTLGREKLPASEVSHRVLQIGLYETAAVLEGVYPNCPDDYLVPSLYSIVGSWSIWKYRSKRFF